MREEREVAANCVVSQGRANKEIRNTVRARGEVDFISVLAVRMGVEFQKHKSEDYLQFFSSCPKAYVRA
jgi:hypothetical protein